MKHKFMIAIVGMLAVVFGLTACGNPVKGGTVVSTVRVETPEGEKCAILYITRQQNWETDEQQRNKVPKRQEVECDEEFDNLKPGDFWDEL